MIIVTEIHTLDGTGDVRTNVEYQKANDYRVGIHNQGDLLLGRTTIKKPVDLTPASINYIEEEEWEALAYYPCGSYFKFTIAK